MWNYENPIMKTGYINDGKPVPLTPKLNNSNCAIPVERQAKLYADWIIDLELSDAAPRIKSTLNFYPLKKSPLAHANIFRLHTLAALMGEPSALMGSAADWLPILQAAAIKSGYTINEYSLDS